MESETGRDLTNSEKETVKEQIDSLVTKMKKIEDTGNNLNECKTGRIDEYVKKDKKNISHLNYDKIWERNFENIQNKKVKARVLSSYGDDTLVEVEYDVGDTAINLMRCIEDKYNLRSCGWFLYWKNENGNILLQSKNKLPIPSNNEEIVMILLPMLVGG